MRDRTLVLRLWLPSGILFSGIHLDLWTRSFIIVHHQLIPINRQYRNEGFIKHDFMSSYTRKNLLRSISIPPAQTYFILSNKFIKYFKNDSCNGWLCYSNHPLQSIAINICPYLRSFHLPVLCIILLLLLVFSWSLYNM